MSRSKGDRGWQNKAEFWSRRPCAGDGSCRSTKKNCTRKERAAEKELIRQELKGAVG